LERPPLAVAGDALSIVLVVVSVVIAVVAVVVAEAIGVMA
jgi:hypothetical protein